MTMQMSKAICCVLLLFCLCAGGLAQEEAAEFTSTVNWLYTACEDRMVIDLSGTVEPGYDLYFQAFNAYGGLGRALTGLRRVEVDGDYALSQVLSWENGEQLELGAPVSVVIRIGAENDPDDTLFQSPSDDVLGECGEPGNTLVEGEAVPARPTLLSSAGVFLPDGGMLNPIYALPPEPIVQIGARVSEGLDPGRTYDPGLIYAECADVPGAEPGILYDTDNIRLFWSWYATTRAFVQDHIDHAQYAIRLNGLTLPTVQLSEIKQVPGSNDWWVFYTVNLGDKWEPGHYEITFAVGWDEAISDGYEEFGPGTAQERLGSGCRFRIQQNPYGLAVLHENPSMPLKAYP